MSDYIPRHTPGTAVTFSASADVTGGRLVIASGVKTVATATLDAPNVVGVAGFDVKSGDPVTVFPRPTGVHALVAGGGITAGAKVVAGAAGKVVTIGSNTNPIGIALETAAADNDVIDVLFI